MTPDFIRGVEHAKKVLRQLSVQAPQTKDDERIWSLKDQIMQECVDAACRALDQDVTRGTIEEQP